MNKPDDKTLKSWLDGELTGQELHNVEAWAQNHAGELDQEFKCEIGWNALTDAMMERIPQSEEPPYPEFFNSKIQQAILDEQCKNTVLEKPFTSIWEKLRLMVLPAAFAAIVAFYAGTKMQDDVPNPSEPKVSSVRSTIYVPNDGIEAAVSDSNNATEIVLSGLEPISDELDIAAGQTSPGHSPMMANSQNELNTLTFY
jgi:hypothetical protein